jgi:hypothetical protein
MLSILAYADNTDNSQANLEMMLLCAVEVAVAGLMIFITMVLTQTRRHKQAEVITAVAIIWGLATIGSLTYTTVRQFKWTQEYNTRLLSGYLDPSDPSQVADQPQIPWVFWSCLAAVYVLMMLWVYSQKNPPPTNGEMVKDEQGA